MRAVRDAPEPLRAFNSIVQIHAGARQEVWHGADCRFQFYRSDSTPTRSCSRPRGTRTFNSIVQIHLSAALVNLLICSPFNSIVQIQAPQHVVVYLAGPRELSILSFRFLRPSATAVYHPVTVELSILSFRFKLSRERVSRGSEWHFQFYRSDSGSGAVF